MSKQRAVMAGLGIAASIMAYFAIPFEGEGVTVKTLTPEKQIVKTYKAYKCAAGYWTIGRGHKLGKDDKFKAMTATETQVEEWYKQDVAIAEAAYDRLVNKIHHENVKASAMDFIFNAGQGNFASSTLRKKLNAEIFNRVATCGEYLRWMGAGGKDCSKPEMKCGGIPERRKSEKELCLSDKISVVDFSNGTHHKPDGAENTQLAR